jgi:N-glycosylase/DNA lyase
MAEKRFVSGGYNRTLKFELSNLLGILTHVVNRRGELELELDRDMKEYSALPHEEKLANARILREIQQINRFEKETLKTLNQDPNYKSYHDLIHVMADVELSSDTEKSKKLTVFSKKIAELYKKEITLVINREVYEALF